MGKKTHGKYKIYIYKMPVSYDLFQLASCYMNGQLYANQSPVIETIYENTEKIEKADYKIKGKRYYHIESYIPKIAYALIPKDCTTITELSQTVRGDCQNKFECQLYSTLQESKESCIQYFLQQIPQEYKQQACKGIYYKSFNLPKETNNDKQFIFLGKMVYIKVNIFGKSLIESLVLKYYRKMYKTNFKNLFQDYQTWSKFTFDQSDDLRTGKLVKSADMDQFKDFDSDKNDIEASSSKSNEFDLQPQQQEEYNSQVVLKPSELKFDINSF